MKFYVDKDNMLSLLKSGEKLFIDDIIKVFRIQADIDLNFGKDEILKNDIIKAFFLKISEGRRRETLPKFRDEVFPVRPLCADIHTTMGIGDLKSAYLLSDDYCDTIAEDGAIAIKGIGQEINLFDQLVFLKKDYDFEKRMDIGSVEYGKWSDLEKFTMPFTDVLIVDQFVFSDSSLMESNYLACLKTLHSRKNIKTNIIVYTDYDEFIRGGRSFKIIERKTKKAVKEMTGIKPSFTLILVRKQRGQKSFSEHDRTIWTNYFRIYTGDSINHFNSKGEKVTTGREIQLVSHLKEENSKLSNKLIDDIQRNIDGLGRSGSDQIQGDYISNILKF